MQFIKSNCSGGRKKSNSIAIKGMSTDRNYGKQKPKFTCSWCSPPLLQQFAYVSLHNLPLRCPSLFLYSLCRCFIPKRMRFYFVAAPFFFHSVFYTSSLFSGVRATGVSVSGHSTSVSSDNNVRFTVYTVQCAQCRKGHWHARPRCNAGAR